MSCLRGHLSNVISCDGFVSPGDDIPGAAAFPDTINNNRVEEEETNWYGTFSGTSQAAPFVTGVAALYLEQFPSLTPTALSALLQRDATAGMLHENLMHVFSGTPNLLLNTQQLSR
jgi:subtilisin family serine protease